jgi:hypothetical protein
MLVAMKAPRRTHAQVVSDKRAKNSRDVAGPIAVARAARRMDRVFSPSAREIARNLRHANSSLTEIARQLEHMGFRTPRGGLRWTEEQVRREIARPSVERAERGIPSRKHLVRVLRPRATEAYRDIPGGYTGGKADVVRGEWFNEAVQLPPSQPRPPEPLLDNRGRVLKGRRFSKIKRSP